MGCKSLFPEIDEECASKVTKSISHLTSPCVDALDNDDNAVVLGTIGGDVPVDVTVRKECCPDNEFRLLFPTGEGVLLTMEVLLILLVLGDAEEGDSMLC